MVRGGDCLFFLVVPVPPRPLQCCTTPPAGQPVRSPQVTLDRVLAVDTRAKALGDDADHR